MFRPDENQKENSLAKYLRQLSAGDYLYKAGDLGNTMHIIMSGSLQVFDASGPKERMIGVLSAGEIFGEKALIVNGPYRRPCTIKAAEPTTLVEIELGNVKILQNLIPDFVVRLLRMLSARLDTVYELTKVLRPAHPTDRLCRCLIYFSKDPLKSRNAIGGTELLLTVQDISETIDVEPHVVEACLDELNSKRIVIKGKTSYLLVDATALLQYSSTLKEKIAA